MNGLFGWQLGAARVACAMGIRDVAKETGIALSSVVRLEKLDEIEVQKESDGRRYGGTLASTVERLVDCFAKHGIELRPATSAKPAAVVCIDTDKLSRRRKSEFKGRARAREA